MAFAATAGVQAAESAPRAPAVAELPAILAAVRAPGAKAVLINVWATWCDPCREELPAIARFYRQHRAQGLRLVLVSADALASGAEIRRVLAAAGMPGDTPSFIKRGDDMKFIDGLDRRWSGALPASFLFDGGGHERRWWGAPVTATDLELGVAGLLPAAPSSSSNPNPDKNEKRQKTMTFASATLATALTAATPTAALLLGTVAPASNVRMKNAVAVDGKPGKPPSIADVAGKAGTLVVFTCDHCPFARGWEGRIVELANASSKKGIGVILINANDPAQHDEDGFAGMQARARSAGMQVPYVLDETSNVARAFGATVTPEAFLFDAHGKLAYHGTVDDNLEAARTGPKAAPQGRLGDRRRHNAAGRRDQESRLQHQVPRPSIGSPGGRIRLACACLLY